jgi:hypothetical protein
VTMTIEDLRAQLATLTAEYASIFAELTPTSKPGPGGRFVWRDEDLAIWMVCSVDTVRIWIVEHLTDFAVSEDSRFALLNAVQFAALSLDAHVTAKAARVRELDFIEAQLQLVNCRLRELGGG